MKVTFCRSVMNSDGQFYEASIFSVVMPSDIGERAAIAGAADTLQRKLRVARWEDVAEYYTIAK